MWLKVFPTLKKANYAGEEVQDQNEMPSSEPRTRKEETAL